MEGMHEDQHMVTLQWGEHTGREEEESGGEYPLYMEVKRYVMDGGNINFVTFI